MIASERCLELMTSDEGNREQGTSRGVGTISSGSCLKTGQHFNFVIIYLLLPIKCIIFDSVSKILFIFFIANNNYDTNNENIAP